MPQAFPASSCSHSVGDQYSASHALIFASMAIADDVKTLKLFSEDDEI
jgi:hypothetical protein